MGLWIADFGLRISLDNMPDENPQSAIRNPHLD